VILVEAAVIPEPLTMLSVLAGAGALAGYARRRRRGGVALLLAVGLLGLLTVPAAAVTDYTWTGATSTDWNTATNWSPNWASGDDGSADLEVSGTPTNTTINASGSELGNDFSGMTFALGLTTDITLSGGARWNGNGESEGFIQNSVRAITIDAKFNFRANDWIKGSGSGKVTFSGRIKKGQGSGNFTINVDNPEFDVDFTDTFERGNDNFTFVKTGAGKFTMSGTWCTDTGDYNGTNKGLSPLLDLQGGTWEVTGTMAGSVDVNGGTFTGGSGTIVNYIDGTSADLIDFDQGALDISTLTVDFAELGSGATELQYVLVDYSDAGAAPTMATNPLTDDSFFDATNIPDGYAIVNDTGNEQILLAAQPVIPEPLTMLSVLAGAGALAGYLRRRRS
jgi:hypothetical protein